MKKSCSITSTDCRNKILEGTQSKNTLNYNKKFIGSLEGSLAPKKASKPIPIPQNTGMHNKDETNIYEEQIRMQEEKHYDEATWDLYVLITKYRKHNRIQPYYTVVPSEKNSVPTQNLASLNAKSSSSLDSSSPSCEGNGVGESDEDGMPFPFEW